MRSVGAVSMFVLLFLARVFQKGLGETVGYALPIRSVGGGRWESGAWFLRDDEILWLLPGDSPMGLRLPLDSIPWVSEREYPWTWQRDPSAAFPPLPAEFTLPGAQRFLRGEAAARPAILAEIVRAPSLIRAAGR